VEHPGVRWSNLFDDLEGQLEHELGAEDVDFRAEEERLRLGRLSLRNRFSALRHAGKDDEQPVSILLDGGRPILMRLATVGRDWLAGDLVDGTSRRPQCIVPLDSVAGIELTPAQLRRSLESIDDDGPGLSARLGIAFVLRDLCRRRRALDLVLPHGEIHGTIDRVGRDHLDLAVHEPDEPRRQRAVRRLLVVPFRQLLFVRL
jgi:hypothetical protein